MSRENDPLAWLDFARRDLAPERFDQIERFLNYLRNQITIERVILYGSQARGQIHAESDIDLAILSPNFENLDWFGRLRLLLRAAWKASTDLVEPVGYTAQEFDHSQPGTFANEIKRSGVVVYDATASRTPLAIHEAIEQYKASREAE